MASTRPPHPGDKNVPNNKKTARPDPIKAARPVTNPAPKPSDAAPTVKPVAATTTTRTSSSATNRRPVAPAPRPPIKKSNNLPIFLIGGLALLLIIGAAAIFLTSNSQKTSTGPQSIDIRPDATAKVDTFPNQGQQHIAQGQAHEPYNSDPPTSGPHYVQAAGWGIYNETLPDENTVHNLEHGGIVISYVCDGNCSDAINQLSNYARRYPREVFTGILLQPRRSLPDGAKIAVTSWQNRLLLKSLDTKKIDEFVAKYFNKGPESAG